MPCQKARIIASSIYFQSYPLGSRIIWIVNFRLFFFSNVLLVLCEFHSMHPNPTHLPLYSYLLSTFASSPKAEKKHLTVEAVMYHSVSHRSHPFIHTLLANVHCNDCLVWYGYSGFCDSVNPGASLGLLLDILLDLCVTEIL